MAKRESGDPDRLLFVAPEMEARGTNEYVVHLANELQRRNLTVAVFGGPGAMFEVLKDKGIPSQTFERLGKLRMRSAERERFGEEIRKFDPQIVHAQTVRVARLVKQLGKQVDVPVVLTMHAPPRKVRAFRSIAEQVSGIIATSEDVREELVNECRVEKSKIVVIPNGIDIDAVAGEKTRPIFSSGSVVLGSVGPVEHARGHELFVRAASRTVGEGQRWHFVVAGKGEELPHLRKLRRELDLEECLTFARDFSSYDEVLDALDIVIQSAQVDVSGFSILDAMANGRPVIAFNTGTACEMIEDGRTGRLVPKDNVESLASAMQELASQPEKARRIGEGARRAVGEKFNIRRVADRTLEFYDRLLSGGTAVV
ncbi:MAG: glycosyltransferase family 4 protein [Candidatus Brocadiia bacterium]